MRFYKLLDALGSANNGTYPQVELDPDDWTKVVTPEGLKWKRIDYWDDPSTPTPQFHLFKKAKLTDYLSLQNLSTNKLLITAELYSFLTTKSISMKTRSAIVVHKARQLTYEFVHLTGYADQFIDFEKSKFYLQLDGRFGQNLKIENYEHLQLLKKEIPKLPCSTPMAPNKIRCYEAYIKEHDPMPDLLIFEVDFLRHSARLIPEKLKVELENLQFTGMRFEPFSPTEFDLGNVNPADYPTFEL